MPTSITLTDRIRILDGDLTLLELLCKGASRQRQSNPATPPVPTTTSSSSKCFWPCASPQVDDDCFEGLSESFMLEKVIKPLACAGLSYPEKRVTFLAAVEFVRMLITEQLRLKDAKASEKQQKMYKGCLDALQLVEVNKDPKMAEAWYQRRLNHLVEAAFFPDLDDLRDARFCRVLRDQHSGRQWSDNVQRCQRSHTENHARADRPGLAAGRAIDRAEWRQGCRRISAALSARMQMYHKAHCDRLGLTPAQQQKVRASWYTMPELKRAICILQGDGELQKDRHLSRRRGEKAQAGEKTVLLKPADVNSMRLAAMNNLKARGYSDASLKEMLTYYRANKMWRTFNSGGHNAYC